MPKQPNPTQIKEPTSCEHKRITPIDQQNFPLPS